MYNIGVQGKHLGCHLYHVRFFHSRLSALLRNLSEPLEAIASPATLIAINKIMPRVTNTQTPTPYISLRGCYIPPVVLNGKGTPSLPNAHSCA